MTLVSLNGSDCPLTPSLKAGGPTAAFTHKEMWWAELVFTPVPGRAASYTLSKRKWSALKRYIRIVFVIWLLAGKIHADPFLISDGFTHLELSKPEIWLASAGRSLAEARVAKFVTSTAPQITLQQNESVWLRYDIVSAATRTEAVVVRHEFPWTDRVEFFVLRDSGDLTRHALGGDAVAGVRSERLPLVRFGIAPRERVTLYVNITTVARTSPTLQLYTESALAPRVFAELLAQGLFTGIALMLIIFHLNLYFATRDPMLLGYLAYLISAALFIPLRSGILPQLFFGRYAQLSDAIWVVLVSACYFTGVAFVRVFFSLRSTWPRADRVVFIVQVLTLVPVFALLMGRREAYIAENLFGLIVGPPLLALGVYQAFRHRDQSVYFVVGYSMPIIAAIFDNLVENGLLPNFAGRNEMLPAAMAIEFLLFALVIYRMLANSEISRSRDNERLSRVHTELSFARSIQKSLLPPLAQRFGAVEINAAYRSEKEVGSDYFDVVTAGVHTIGVLVTDTGAQRTSSLASALDASAVRMAFRNSFADQTEPRQVVRRMLEVLVPVMRARPVGITYVVLNTLTGQGKLYCRANPSPLLVKSDGTRVEFFASQADQMPDAEADISLTAGDQLVIMTAGLARRMNLRRDRLSPAERIQKIQNRPARMLRNKAKRAREDLTLVALSFQGSGA